MQHNSVGYSAAQRVLRGCNVAQKSYAVRLRCVIAQYGAVQHIAQQYAGSSEGCKVAHIFRMQIFHRVQHSWVVVYCVMAFFKEGQSTILYSARHPMEVFFAERTSDEENHDISAVVSKCQNAGLLRKWIVRHQHFYGKLTVSVQHRHSGIRVSVVPLVTD